MTEEQIAALVSEQLTKFYGRRLKKIEGIRLRPLLQRKNPYLFKALGYETVETVVKGLLESFIWSSDETIFGNEFFEPVARRVAHGLKSQRQGMDVQIETDESISILSIKSGPNIFNKGQKDHQNQDFIELRSRMQRLEKPIEYLLGVGYGRTPDAKPSRKQVYKKVCGQDFWSLLTGDSDFYLRIHRLMSDHPLLHKPEHQKAWNSTVNRLTAEFIQDFVDPSGQIDWDRIVAFNSGSKESRESLVLSRPLSRKPKNKKKSDHD